MTRLLFLIIGLAMFSTSCTDILEMGLEDLPLADKADIENFYFEYRFSSQNSNGFVQLEYKTLHTVVTMSGTNVNCVVTIPAPSGSFTPEIAAQVNLTNIVGYCNISDAATIEPINNAPVLGTIGDWSQPRTYKVTAANGTSKTWTISSSLVP